MTAAGDSKPAVGVIMGDPAGIGPEVMLKALASPDVRAQCRPIVIGQRRLLDALQRRLALPLRLAAWPAPEEMGDAIPVCESDGPPSDIPLGMASQAAGEATLAALRQGWRLAAEGHVGALAMAPITKESLALAQGGYHSEGEVFAGLAGVEPPTLVVRSGDLFRATATDHIAFRDIVARLSTDGIVETALRLAETMASFGLAAPRLAVAALNPHAGEGGLLGDEERTVIAPAIEALCARGYRVDGPVPADTVWVRATRGEYDGIVYLYHDQGNIAMKAAAFGQGVLILAGLPHPVVTPAHGSALDIAGQGVADAENMVLALHTAAALAAKAALPQT